MSVVDWTGSMAFELVGKQAVMLLRENLNPGLLSVAQSRDAIDDALGFPRTNVELVDREDFYYGHRPSLVEAPIERYPNCSVYAYAGSPAATNPDFDVENVLGITMYVELMCKSLGSEEEVNVRIQRMADACHSVLMSSNGIGGAYVEGGGLPNVIFTDVFVRPETKGHGARFLWQGCRLEYSLTKVIPL